MDKDSIEEHKRASVELFKAIVDLCEKKPAPIVFAALFEYLINSWFWLKTPPEGVNNALKWLSEQYSEFYKGQHDQEKT